ncbi:MAG: NAD(+)/NADH kinase, partial [Oxalobacteraceae bacterium]
DRVVPILGVNLGHIGFLTEVARDELLDVLPQAVDRTLPTSHRMRLDVEVRRGSQVLLHRRVLNDAVVAMRSLARIATFRLKTDGTAMTSIRGDGVIVSTPTGSTAYALASGGPVVSPEVEAMLVTPIAPHMLTQRPLVMPATGELIITLVSESDAYASLDGHFGHEIGEGDTLVVRRAPVGAQLIGVPWRNYYQMLRTKLRWGDT